MSEDQNCLDCFFCRNIQKDDDGDETGTCKRFPPVLSVMGDEEANEFEHGPDGEWLGRYEFDVVPWVQPIVHCQDWCGEFKQKGEST